MNDDLRVEECARFTIPSLPPSVNAVYQIIFHQRKVEMKPEVRLWKTKAKEFIPRIKPSETTHFFRIDCKFRYPQFHKNGNLKKFDSPNLLKVLIDAIAEKVGFKDELVKYGSWETYNDDNESVEVVVSRVFDWKA